MISQARTECQSHRLTVEDAPTVEYMARFIATIQQRYTQRGGRRPFGISVLLCGHDPDGTPRLFQTDPAGTYSAWRANAVGRNASTLREFLEAQYKDGMEVRSIGQRISRARDRRCPNAALTPQAPLAP